jgi:Protein of unknown function (DUF1501)
MKIIFCFIALIYAGMVCARDVKPRAKAVIEIWLWGGPSQLETFDPKPNAKNEYNGGKKSIKTNVEGIEISEYLPKLAKIADKYSIIRSMTHGINGHETATYIMQTGRKAGGRLVYPAIGAVVGMMKGYDHGYKGQIPPYVVLTRAKGRFAEIGFLPHRYMPFVTGGDPARTPFTVDGIVVRGLTQKRQEQRRGLLSKLDTIGRTLPDNQSLKKFDADGAKAYELVLGDAGKVFDLSQESKEMRERYGMNTLGQACLQARRLIENGVVYVTINAQGWDTHKRHFADMGRKLPELDQGLAALLADLDERDLLDSTIVWCGGEFGRGPKIQDQAPWNGGRSHYGKCFSMLVAGGGFKGGKVVGASDENAANVIERPVSPADLFASIYELLGIDPNGSMPNSPGQETKIMPGAKNKLTELYEASGAKK